MAIDKTGFEKADRFAMGLEDLQSEAGGPAWFYLPEIALRASMHDDGYMRRRQLVNNALKFFRFDRSDEPNKAPLLRYGKAEAVASLGILEQAGLAESTWGDSIVGYPEPHESLQKLYRLVPEERAAASMAEVAARRIPRPEEPYMM